MNSREIITFAYRPLYSPTGPLTAIYTTLLKGFTFVTIMSLKKLHILRSKYHERAYRIVLIFRHSPQANPGPIELTLLPDVSCAANDRLSELDDYDALRFGALLLIRFPSFSS